MRFLITLLLFGLITSVQSQTSTCGDPSPLCVLNTYDYPLGSNIMLTPGNSYGCIPTNTFGVPAVMGYFYAEIRGAGPIELKFDSDNDLSVAAWGPFPDLATAAGSCGSLPNPTACSADPFSNSETIIISGQVGEVFLIFVKGLAPPAYVGQFSVTQTNSGFPGSGGLACIDFGNEMIICPGNIAIVDCDDTLPSPHENIFDFIAAGGNADNLCTDRVAITYDEYENGGTGCTGDPRILERRYWLQDQCGNLATCLQQFSYPILDEPLELNCPPSNAPSQLVTCLDDLEVNIQDITAVNACGIELSFDIGEPQINDSSLGLECDLTCLHYPITVTDECGRVGECTLSFTVYGNVPEFLYDESEPNEECRIAPLSVDCRDGVENSLETWLDTLSVFSTCGNRMDLETTFDEDNFVDVCSESLFQSQDIIITATDACGRTNTCRSSINIIKTEGPKITSQAKNKWVTCSQNVDSIFQAYIADNAGANAIDYCSATTFTTNPANPEYFISCNDEEGLSIEFIASDACGNSSKTVGVFKVLNDEEPILTIPPSDLNVDCIDDVDAEFTSFINNQAGASLTACGNINWTTDPVSPTVPTLSDQCDEASTTVTFIGQDDCGQEVNVTATFTVSDNDAPVMSGGENLDLECGIANADDIDAWLSANGSLTATDLCSSVTITNDYDASLLDVECHDDPINVSFTATDACGNLVSQTLTISISDNTPPVFTFVPTSINEDPIATDECSEVTITFVDVTNGGQTIRTYTATDACGNETSVTVTFGEVDNTPPVITFIPTEVGCDGVLDPNSITATDDSGQVSIMVSLVSETGSCDTGFTYVYTVTATDDAGNQTTETVTYNIPADNAPPVFTSVPQNLTFFCSEEVIIPDAIAEDDCDEVTITCVEVLNAGAVVDNCNNGYGYDIFKTWTATDACGNTATAITEAWVVPDDYIGPRFEFVPESMVMECGDDASFGEAICTTACGEVDLTYVDEIIQGDCSQAGQMIRTWTGVDDCGNVTNAQQIITIPPDMEAPVFTFVPAYQTIKDFDDYSFETPICEDNCATINHLGIDYTDEPLSEGCGFTRTWVVSDLCGNTTEASQTIYIDDTEAPVITGAPEIIEVVCGETAEFSNPLITDNMSEVDITIVDATLENNCTGVNDLMRTWTATDGCGNESSFIQIIYTEDDTAPEFAAMPSEKILSCNDAFEFDQAIANDNCSEIQSLEYVEVDLSDDNCTSCISKVMRTWEAVDACGNVATISQTLTLLDEEAPSINISGDAITAYDCGQELSIEMPTAIDNCGDAVITFEDSALETQCNNEASFIRTWIATDNVGNENRKTQQFIFTDNEAPVFAETLSDIVLNCGEEIPSAAENNVTAMDNCDEDIEMKVSEEEQSVENCKNNIILTRTYTATDDCGNAALLVQNIYRNADIEGPVFGQSLSDVVLKCGEEIPSAENNVTAIDNCDQDVELFISEIVQPDGDCVNNIILTRTYTAIDDCGNETKMSYTISREADTEHPQTMNELSDKEVFCGQEITFDAPVFEDNCTAELEILIDTKVEEDACSASHTRTWTATDNCGNATEVSQRVFWEDKEAPEILMPLTSLEMSVEEYLAWSPEAAVDMEDSCSDIDPDATNIEKVWNENCEDYRIVYTYAISDMCGNANSIDFEVVVQDALPSFTMDAPEEVDCGTQFSVSALDVEEDDHDFEWMLIDPSGTWEIINTDNSQVEILAGEDTAELQLTVTNKLGCKTISQQTIVCAKVNSVTELEAISSLELSPNPVADQLTIRFASAEFIEAELIVYDLLGRTILQQNANILAGDNQFDIDAAQFDQGTYILEISSKQGSAVKKFMKF